MAEGRFSIETVFKAIDKMTAPVNRMSNRIGKFTRKLQRGFRNLDRTVSKVNKSINVTIKRIAKTAAVGFGLAGASVLKFVKESSKIEDAIAAFQPIVGGIENAKKAVDDLNKTAASTPFQFETLANASQLLLGFGAATQEELIPTIRMLGDTAGGNAERLSGIALAFSQIKAGGKATMQDINQLINNGVPILGELADMWGVTVGQAREMVSQGKATGEEVTKAFKKMTSEGGRFFRGMEIASKTFSGKLSTLKDNINLTAGAIGTAFMPKLKGGTDRLILIAGKVREWTNTNRELIAQKVDAFIAKVKSIFEAMRPGLNALIQTLKNLISIFANLFKTTKDGESTLTTLINFFNVFSIVLLEISEIIKFFDRLIGGRLIKTIIGLVIVLKILAGAFTLLNIIMTANPIGLIIVGIGLLIGSIIFLIRHIDFIKAQFVRMWEILKENPILGMIFPIFALIGAIGFLIKHWQKFKEETIVTAKAFVEIWQTAKTFYVGLWSSILKVMDIAVTKIIGLIDKLKKPFGFVKAGVSRLKGFFGVGDDEDDQRAPGTPQTVGPEERTARLLEEKSTTNKSELTIKDETGRAEMTGKSGPGVSFNLAESGAF